MPDGTMRDLITTDGATITAYHVEPLGQRKGGLVLVQEIFGVTDHIRELCDGFAREGYDVIAPSLYDRQHKGFEADYTQEGIAAALRLRDAHKMETSIADMQLCIDWLRAKGNEKVFMTGYCYGGSVTWVAACRCRGLTAAAGYYGRLIAEHVHEAPRCPIILHFGRTDHSIPMELVEAIKAARPHVPVHVYEAGHGFNSDRRTDYHEPSSRLARERTLALFANA
ncbi:MAG: dienelactone hydrolase family protein [Alphaproteobacteria bacterium]|nr:dienelactone hydrolase family protein [Alphaproteobacteria bacterium]